MLNQRKYKSMLWKDELGDDFLLLKGTEVYEYSNKEVRLCIFYKKLLSGLKKQGLIYDLIETDEQITLASALVRNLPQIIERGKFKRRPYIKGKWVSRVRRMLGHDILAYK